MFERMVGHLQAANQSAVEANRKSSSDLVQILEEERADSEAERDILMSQIKHLMEESREKQFNRLRNKVDGLQTVISSSGDSLEQATAQYDRQVDEWVTKDQQFAKNVTTSKDEISSKMQDNWEASVQCPTVYIRNCANCVPIVIRSTQCIDSTGDTVRARRNGANR